MVYIYISSMEREPGKFMRHPIVIGPIRMVDISLKRNFNNDIRL